MNEELSITIEHFPEVRQDWSAQMGEIADYMEDRVLRTLAEGGDPPWERTKFGAIPRLYDRFASTVRSEVEKDRETARISIGSGMPDVFAHHFGAEFTQMVSERQRGFFWSEFYDTGDEMWKWMALSKVIHIKMPARTLINFQDEDEELIDGVFADNLFVYSEAESGGIDNSWMIPEKERWRGRGR